MPRKRSNKRSTKQSIKRKNKRFTKRFNKRSNKRSKKRSIKRTKRIKYKGGGQKMTPGPGGLATDDSERNREPNKYYAVSEDESQKFNIKCPVCQHDKFKRRHTYMNTSYLGGTGLLRRGKYMLKSYNSVDRVLDKELTILDCVTCSNFQFFRSEVKLSDEPVVEPVVEEGN